MGGEESGTNVLRLGNVSAMLVSVQGSLSSSRKPDVNSECCPVTGYGGLESSLKVLGSHEKKNLSTPFE